MSTRLEEVMARIGSRPTLIHLASASDFFGSAAPYRIEDGVAMIDIAGPLSNAVWSWGGTTYGDIQDQCKIAAADPNVKGILLNVNSPGGETDNAFETAALIAKIAAVKPVYAVAATMAYSAAYLLASQAEKVYCTPTSGGVGSIGVYCAHFDYSEMLKQNGIKVTLISAGEGKTSGSPYVPLSSDDESQFQEDIDRLYGEFVAAVASGRGLDAAAIVKLGSRCYGGSASAIAKGLADAPGDLSTAWVDLCAEIARPSMTNKRSVASATNKEKQMAETTAADTLLAATKIAEAKALEAAALATAKAEGYADAAHIVELCQLAGSPDAVKYIGEKKTAADVRKALIDAKAAEQAKTTVDPSVMPGADAAGADSKQTGKAKPWSEIMSALGGKKEKR